jgi:hypothetical protein
MKKTRIEIIDEILASCNQKVRQHGPRVYVNVDDSTSLSEDARQTQDTIKSRYQASYKVLERKKKSARARILTNWELHAATSAICAVYITKWD